MSGSRKKVKKARDEILADSVQILPADFVILSLGFPPTPPLWCDAFAIQTKNGR